jgi:hypothetical protein
MSKRATELAEAHWSYIKGLMEACSLPEDIVNASAYIYITAFEHGYKHSQEDAAKEATDAP